MATGTPRRCEPAFRGAWQRPRHDRSARWHVSVIKTYTAHHLPYPVPLLAPSMIAMVHRRRLLKSPPPPASPSSPSPLRCPLCLGGCLAHPSSVPCRPLGCSLRHACAACRLWRAGGVSDVNENILHLCAHMCVCILIAALLWSLHHCLRRVWDVCGSLCLCIVCLHREGVPVRLWLVT